ncbi:MAG: hypothetical protein KGI50_03440 [Patescibacteria group bacterium]|nr:hypothetical protein [Patescibacteria group bacterium]MDE2438345.1 hypothetical protein [Patescibacteria group bacterium]
MNKDALSILFFTLLAGVGLFVLRSVPLNNFITPLSSLTASSTLTSRAPTYRNPSPSASPSSPTVSASTSTPINPYDIPAGFSANDLSPYFHKIRFSTAYPGYGSSYGQVALSSNFYDDEHIDITGWLIQGNQGSQIVPHAINVYDPTGLAPETDIIMKQNSIVRMYSTASAIGRNLQLNECSGYLANANSFTPELPLTCPRPTDSEISGYSNPCQDYVSSLSTCGAPAANPPGLEYDNACRSYLLTLNYRGCYERHVNDVNFLGNEWWVWTNNNFVATRRENLRLFDNNHLLVDTYQY